MLIGSGILYVLFTDATLQPWNARPVLASQAKLEPLLQTKEDPEKCPENDTEKISNSKPTYEIEK